MHQAEQWNQIKHYRRDRALVGAGRVAHPRQLAVADVNFVLDYFRLSRDHRLLFGAG